MNSHELIMGKRCKLMIRGGEDTQIDKISGNHNGGVESDYEERLNLKIKNTSQTELQKRIIN